MIKNGLVLVDACNQIIEKVFEFIKQTFVVPFLNRNKIEWLISNIQMVKKDRAYK